MATTEQWTQLGTPVDVISNAELSGLASGSIITGATTYDNSAGVCFAFLTFTCAMNIAATAGTNFLVWVHTSIDGTNFESVTAVYFAIKPAKWSFGAPTSTGQVVSTQLIQLMPGKQKYSMSNNATGQATKTDTTATGSKLQITPVGRQAV